jgi:hypothetical protein
MEIELWPSCSLFDHFLRHVGQKVNKTIKSAPPQWQAGFRPAHRLISIMALKWQLEFYD